MRFLIALRLGLRRVHRRPGLIVIAWLAALAPALLLTTMTWSDLAEAMDRSPFARQALEGNRWGVWTDFAASPAADLAPLWDGLDLRFLLVVVLQALVSAGIVETLLGAAPRSAHPFLLGIGRHGWRFLRSLFWFGLSVALLAVAAGGWFGGALHVSQEAADAGLHLWGLAIGIVLTVLLFAFLDLGYDLSRIAGAAHRDPRMLKGYLVALGHSFRHPLLLLPLWLIFALLGLAASIGYLALRAAWSPGSLGAILLLLLVGQVFLLLHAWLRVGLWGSLIAYYQAIGEPRWCIRGRRPRPAPALSEAGSSSPPPPHERGLAETPSPESAASPPHTRFEGARLSRSRRSQAPSGSGRL